MRKVPKLRFKEFIDEWEEKNILEISSMKARIGWQNLRKEEHLEKGEFYLITGTDFYLDKIKWNTAKFVEKERYLQDSNIILKEGDILITKDGSIGKVAFVEGMGDKKATLNNGIFRIRIEKENSYSKYLYYTFLSKRFKNFLQQLTAGSTIVHLYQKDFEKYKVAFSSLQEQEKIAKFLSSVDKKISLTEEKLELFKEYKKGVMQKIFSQELRFKDNDGNDYPEWVEKRFDEVYVVISNKEFQIKNSEILNIGKYKVIDQGKEKIAGYSNNELKLFKNIPIIVYGDHTTNIKFIDFNFILGGDGTKLLTTKEQRNLKFLYFALDNYNITPEGYKRHFSILKEIKLYIPSSLEEQQKIADFLSSIDIKIENIEKELENLKEFKKGLLQQMFV